MTIGDVFFFMLRNGIFMLQENSTKCSAQPLQGLHCWAAEPCSDYATGTRMGPMHHIENHYILPWRQKQVKERVPLMHVMSSHAAVILWGALGARSPVHKMALAHSCRVQLAHPLTAYLLRCRIHPTLCIVVARA